jgi:putative flippase GtrA
VSVLVSVPLFATGLALLWTLKSVVGLEPLMAYLVNIPVMSTLGFLVNRVVWKDRNTQTRKGVKRWVAKEGPMHLAGPLIYAALLDFAGFSFLLASIGKSATLAIPVYVINNWVFTPSDHESEGSQA